MTPINHPTKYRETDRLIWQRVIGKLAATSLAGWLLRSNLHRLDRLALKLSRGRMTATTMLTGLPVIWLETVGAQTGHTRVTPVAGIYDGNKYILIASYLGSSRNPDWYYNLTAHPRLHVSDNGRKAEFRATEVHGEQRERCWQLALQAYSGFARYAERARGRQIPILYLIPAD